MHSAASPFTAILAAAFRRRADPAASRMLSEMESITKTSLYERVARGVVLTTFGAALARRARKILLELREASRDLIPEPVLERQKSGYPMTQDLRYDESLRAAAKQIIESPDEPGNVFLGEGVKAFLEEEVTEVTFGRRGRLEGAVRINMWLKEYDVELVDIA